MPRPIASEEMPAARNLSRRAALAGVVAVLATPNLAAPLPARQTASDVRRISMISHHTGEKVDAIYFANGRYFQDALDEINWFMRDWRRSTAIHIDPRELDIISATHRRLRTSRPFELISGYRSPETNAMLRARSAGVAKNSLHMVGQAADLRLRDRTLQEIASAAGQSGAGGIGIYARSDFVHLDSGARRRWLN